MAWVVVKEGSWATKGHRFRAGRTWCDDEAVLAQVRRVPWIQVEEGEPPADGQMVEVAKPEPLTGPLTREDLSPPKEEPNEPLGEAEEDDEDEDGDEEDDEDKSPSAVQSVGENEAVQPIESRKPYVCGVGECDRRYASAPALARHQQLHHPELFEGS